MPIIAAIGLTIVTRATELDMDATSTAAPVARSWREPAQISWRARGVGRRRLRRATDVAMMESADLGQRKDAALLGWLDGAQRAA